MKNLGRIYIMYKERVGEAAERIFGSVNVKPQTN